MGAEQVGSAILEWVLGALRRDPWLVVPTLLLATGVAGLAVVEAITLTIQIATTIVHHFRGRLFDLGQALRELVKAVSLQPRKNSDRHFEPDSARPRVVQRNRLAQQQPGLFDRKGGSKNDGQLSAG
jgi:hypothetical protein